MGLCQDEGGKVKRASRSAVLLFLVAFAAMNIDHLGCKVFPALLRYVERKFVAWGDTEVWVG